MDKEASAAEMLSRDIVRQEPLLQLCSRSVSCRLGESKGIRKEAHSSSMGEGKIRQRLQLLDYFFESK